MVVLGTEITQPLPSSCCRKDVGGGVSLYYLHLLKINIMWAHQDSLRKAARVEQCCNLAAALSESQCIAMLLFCLGLVLI